MIQDHLGHHFQGYHLFNDTSMLTFTKWAETFNQQVFSKNCLPNNILMGYSLGGRLALHALLEKPEKWKAAVLVSTHPGLKSEQDKHLRIVSDEIWAGRFENEAWEDLMKAWNAQGVFKNDSVKFQRKESAFDRKSLASALRIWSLGFQQELTDEIASLEIPILWMVGENDTKFLKIAQTLKFKHPQSKLCVVANAGHRLHFEQAEIFKQNVIHFIKNL